MGVVALPSMAEARAWRFCLRFARKGVRPFVSPDVRVSNPRWGDEAFQPIESLTFFLPVVGAEQPLIFMQGMEKYCFFVEAMCSLNGRGGLHALYFAGKLPGQDKVHFWRVGHDALEHSVVQFGYEYAGTAIRGWKAGHTGAHPMSQLVKV